MTTVVQRGAGNKKQESNANGETEEKKVHAYDFGGTPGAAFIIVSLPLTVYFLIWGAREDSAGDVFKKLAPALNDLDFAALFSLNAFKICVYWLLFQALLERLIPGAHAKGLPLSPPDSNIRLEYTINGHRAFWASLCLVCFAHYTNVINLAAVYELFPQLATAAICISFVLSFYLYWRSFSSNAKLASEGNTGSAIYDFFKGRELNPRLFGTTFDLKYFCELRPGLIGWTVFNLGLACKQWQQTGAVSVPMVMVVSLEGLYVWDALYNEKAILSTMDITTDGFGFMLAFGDLGWLPFTYCLQALYLVDHDPDMPMWFYLLALALGLLGYLMFRGSNGLKDDFRTHYRTHPERFQGLQTMETKRGTRLITGSWWGIARKINYTADLVMALSWSMLCGPVLLPYFYPIYMTVLLVHRAYRDDIACQEKYGECWDKYKKKVPYILIPGVY